MPISAENRKRYPADWKQIRERILQRAQNRCERCGVPNHALGYRDATGAFVAASGTPLLAQAGAGNLSYAEAKKLADLINRGRSRYMREYKRIVIVLTVAHLQPPIENCDESNLALWCQQCHNRHDAPMRSKNAATTLCQKQLDKLSNQEGT